MSPKDAWDPRQYERFRGERARPFYDLLQMLEARPGMRLLDLGCGTGELTAQLHERLGAAHTLGVDRSPHMLEQSAKLARSGLDFLQADIAEVAEGTLEGCERGGFDVVFSNAALHWLLDHGTLLAQLTRLLRPGGQLAIQVPHMHHAPTFRAAVEIAQSPPFRDALGGFVQRYGVLDAPAYARLLHGFGFEEQRVRLEVYAHVLPSREAVFEWVKGTTLTPYAERLPPKVYDSFLGHYRERLMLSLKDTRPFLFPFERLLMWARLPR
ncbi:MAG: methyltransferase domain-containing protein [Deltaproteobacteria bacterium]|nr:methyltransferase domain-containing protein [Deltaproteobacteria bacterium]